MLSGNNGILQRATDAKRTAERAEAKEQAQIDIMAYIADKTAKHQDASLDDAKIQEILSDNKPYVKEANDTSFITSKGEYTILYTELYNSGNDIIIPDDTNTTTVEDINSKIGSAVTGYSAKGATWRVFYADENETFLIPDYIEDLIDYNFPSLDNYSGSSNVRNLAYGAKWNKKWLDICSEYGESTNFNAKATAYLCDSENWKDYAVGSANYAVGGATLELLIASWNKSQGASIDLLDSDITSLGINNETPRELADIDCSFGSGLELYSGYATQTWYMATPNSDNENSMVIFDQQGLHYNVSGSSEVRPVVSIPTSKISVNGDVVTVLP